MVSQSPLETDAFDRNVRLFVFGRTAATGNVPAITEVVLYYGNGIWDALGIPAALGTDARIETQCGDCGTAMSLEVRDGALVADQ